MKKKDQELTYEEKMRILMRRQEKAKGYLWKALIHAIILLGAVILSMILGLFINSSLAGIMLAILGGGSAAASILFTVLGLCGLSSKKIKLLSAEAVKPVIEERFALEEYKPMKGIVVQELYELYPGGVKRGVIASGTDLIKASYNGKKFAYSFVQLTELDDSGMSTVRFKGHVIATSLDHKFPVKLIIQTKDAQEQWNGNRQESWDEYLGTDYNVYTQQKNAEPVPADKTMAEKVKNIRIYINCPFTLIIPETNAWSFLILEPHSYWFGGHGEMTMDATIEKAKRSTDYIADLLDILMG